MTGQNAQHWTEDRVSIMITSLKSGYTAAQTAIKLNREFPLLLPVTRNSVISKASRLSVNWSDSTVEKRKLRIDWTPKLIAQIRRMRRAKVIGAERLAILRTMYPDLPFSLDRINSCEREYGIQISGRGDRAKVSGKDLPALGEPSYRPRMRSDDWGDIDFSKDNISAQEDHKDKAIGKSFIALNLTTVPTASSMGE